MSRILFSPVGMTDPVRNGHDGPLIHIIRHYRPDMVYIFFTREAEELENMDGRYTEIIRKLGFSCEIVPINSGISDPSDFDAFLQQFPDCINRMINENCVDTDEFMVNISSGTAQMVSALCLEIAGRKDVKLIPVQVKTPVFGANIRRNDIDLDAEIRELAEEKEPATLSRCVEAKISNFHKSASANQIRSLVEQYDYKGALSLLQPNIKLFNNGKLLKKLMSHAMYRLNLQMDNAMEEIKGLDTSFDFKLPSGDPGIEILEYYYTVRIKQKRGEISDFVLRITPLLFACLREFVNRHIDISKILVIEDDVENVNRNKIALFDPGLLDYLDKELKKKGGFRNSYLNNFILVLIINYLHSKGLIEKPDGIGFLMELERALRNKTAHELLLINETMISRKMPSNNSLKILKKLEKIIASVFPDLDVSGDMIYDQLNVLILKHLN